MLWFLLVIFSIFLACMLWFRSIPKGLPPGPPLLPFVGNALSLLQPGNSYNVLQKWVKQYGPLLRVYVMNTLVIVLGDYKTIHEALIKQADAFSGRPTYACFLPKGVPPKHGLVMSEGDLWKEQRRFALSTLRDFGLGRAILEPCVTAEAEHLTSSITKTQGKPIDLRSFLNNAVSNVICSLVFGRRFHDDDHFCEILENISYVSSESEIEFISPFVICQTLAKLVSVLPDAKKFQKENDQLADYVRKMIYEVQDTYESDKEPSNYIHSFMKSAETGQGESFHSTQLLVSVMDLFMAGTDTAAGTIYWGLYFMARYPHMQERIYKEIADVVGVDGQSPQLAHRLNLVYTDATITEMLRYATLAPMSAMHKVTVDTELLGYKIPKDSLVVPFLWNVLQDPQYYENPEQFKPERFIDEQGKLKKDPQCIPFSTGKRSCLGESLAKMEIFLFFTTLILKFRFSFPPNTPVPPTKRFFGFVSSLAPYEICATPRT